jgi:CHAT domain
MDSPRDELPRFQRALFEVALRRMEKHPNAVVAKWPGVVRVLMGAIASDRWTDEDEACLAGLRAEAEKYRLFEPDDTPPPPLKQQARAFTAVLLAIGHARRVSANAGSPWPQEQPAAAEIASVLAEAEAALTLLTRAEGVDRDMAWIAGLLHVECGRLLVSLAGVTGKTPDLVARVSAHARQVPDDIGRAVPFVGHYAVMLKLFTRELSPLDEAVIAAGDQDRNIWDSGGADYARAEAAAYRAEATGNPQDYRSAIAELQMVCIGLPAGSEVRGRTLTLLADMQLGLAASTDDVTLIPAAIATASTALRVATTPRVAQGAACTISDGLAMMALIGPFHGPFEELSAEVRRALDRGYPHPASPAERAALLAALTAALGMAATTGEDLALRQVVRELAEDAEQALPPAAPSPAAPSPAAPSATAREAEWILLYRTARGLHFWTAAQVMSLGDTAMIPVALRVAAKLERYLADGGTAQERKQLAHTSKQLRRAAYWTERGRPLGTVLTPPKKRPPGPGPFQWTSLRGQPLSPRDAWRLARQGPDGLRSALEQLNQALVTGDHTMPTTERAESLDVLARCYREAGRQGGGAGMAHNAERAALAALRELARCVLITDTGRAVAIAARANEVAARAVGWCLADGRERTAVAVAESGRALVLAAVTQAGRVEELLRGAGEHAAARAWASGAGEADRAAALDTLLRTSGGTTLLAAPTDVGVAGSMASTRLDAVVYLVPADEPGDGPAGARETGHAVLVRPATVDVEVVPLPGLAAGQGTPLARYLTELESALAAYSPSALGGAGFRALAEGPAWAGALDELGRWAYDAIMGPLIAHVRGWQPGHRPRLALIPLGRLGAIPFAAAWTATRDGSRRYAIEDVVLSYAASARLLGEVAARPRQPLDERVVFIADPTGTIHFSRRVTPGVARQLYPAAEVYGMKTAPDGPATVEVILGALPGSKRQGASLLHLTTHGQAARSPTTNGETAPGETVHGRGTNGQPTAVPAVQAYGSKWLPLADILAQARDRAPDAPGGLVITSACLTDVTLADYDESLTVATAFLAAGATAVIGTRWPVDDDTTLALSIRVHQHLKDGHDPAEALRRAQLDLLRPGPALRESLGPAFTATDDARLSHPASWAGHVHHGI